MKTVELSLLIYDGPLARAYLTRLRRQGLRPRHLTRLAISRDISNRKPLAGWLPAFLRRSYWLHCLDLRQNYWPRRLLWLAGAAGEGLKDLLSDATEQIKEMYSPGFRFVDYAQSCTSVAVEGLKDPALARQLDCQRPILYTGGGLVPASLLSLPGARFLHLHPGILPLVRGADGLLWSVALRGRPGISAFWMASGLDTGDLLATTELPPLRFKLAKRPDDLTLYRALFSYIDPLIRAWFLAQRIEELLHGLGTPQALNEGVTFHFMHPLLRRKVFQEIFVTK